MEAIGYWVAGVTVGISFLFLVVRSYNSLFYGLRNRLPPGELGWPLLGQTSELFADFGEGGNPNMFMNRRFEKYGRISAYKTHLFGGPTILLPTYEGIKLVLSSTELFKLGLPKPEQLLGKESFALLKGDRRKRFREILMATLAGPDVLKNVIPIMDRQTKRLLAEAKEKESFDMFELCKALVQASEMEIFFGPFGQDAFDLYAESFHTFVKGFFGFAINFPGFARYDAIKARHNVQKWLQARLDERRAQGKLNEPDAMGFLMNTVEEHGKKLEDHVITSTLFSFFTGSQSTFRPLFWVLYYLTNNPRFIPELREEHQKMAATKRPGEILNREDVYNLPFTKKVWDESLRLVNMFPWIFRIATTDVQFHDITIPKGWKALAFMRALHHDPKVFPDPESYNPHRWDDPKSQNAPFAPFGHGTRKCPGQSQAHYQACMFLHNLVIDFDWEFVDPKSPVRFLPEAKPANCFARLIPLKK